MTEPTTAPVSTPEEDQLRADLNTALWLHAEATFFANSYARASDSWYCEFHEHLRTLRRKIMSRYVDCEELVGFPALFDALRTLLAEGAAAREVLESIDYDPKYGTWRTDPDTQQHMAKLFAELELLRATQPGTVAELTERLVAASSEWDDNTGDDETSRPYLEHLAKAIESWRPVPAEAGDGPDARPAYKLADGEDWEAIARWCGGRLVSHEMADSGEHDTELRLPGKSFRDAAIEDDWIVRDLNGEFQVLREVESTRTALLSAEAGDSTAAETPAYLARAAELDIPTYYLAADAENRFREYVKDALNIDKSLREAWARFEKVLTMFPAARPASSVRTAETPRYFVGPDAFDDTILWRGTGPDDPNCRVVASKGELDGLDRVLWSAAVKQLTGQDVAPDRAQVVTICGSMRFFDDMLKVAEEETAAGRIVLAPFSVVAPEDQGSEFKQMLDDLHRRKIDLSAGIIVVTRDGYIGESTRGEIEYAEQAGKTVRHVDVQADTAGGAS